MKLRSSLSLGATELADKLAEIAQRGPVEAMGAGDKSVGMTLLTLLGVEHKVTSKPAFNGIVIGARREGKVRQANRVNLFAKVPDWDFSTCKSSHEILNRYGYKRDGGLKLYATIRARQANSQGLMLQVDQDSGLLHEVHTTDAGDVGVAAWRLSGLQDRLAERHPASAWVVATTQKAGDREFFHYRYVQFTGMPRTELLPDLLQQGTVTVDHLISLERGRAVDKGPLFKIKPNNVSALFPQSPRFDLMSW